VEVEIPICEPGKNRSDKCSMFTYLDRNGPQVEAIVEPFMSSSPEDKAEIFELYVPVP
jgi:hypothetical protein